MGASVVRHSSFSLIRFHLSVCLGVRMRARIHSQCAAGAFIIPFLVFFCSWLVSFGLGLLLFRRFFSLSWLMLLLLLLRCVPLLLLLWFPDFSVHLVWCIVLYFFSSSVILGGPIETPRLWLLPLMIELFWSFSTLSLSLCIHLDSSLFFSNVLVARGILGSVHLCGVCVFSFAAQTLMQLIWRASGQ